MNKPNRREVYSHISDKRYSKTLAQGNESEKRFAKIMSERGNEVVKATANQDMKLHIDFFINGEGVDVKGNKRSDYLWLELQNVFGGKGWLYGSAKWIVYDVSDLKEFHIYKRTDLLDFVVKNVTETTDSNRDFMKFYKRDKTGGDDKIVRCRCSDIKHLLIQTISYAITKTKG